MFPRKHFARGLQWLVRVALIGAIIFGASGCTGSDPEASEDFDTTGSDAVGGLSPDGGGQDSDSSAGPAQPDADAPSDGSASIDIGDTSDGAGLQTDVSDGDTAGIADAAPDTSEDDAARQPLDGNAGDAAADDAGGGPQAPPSLGEFCDPGLAGADCDGLFCVSPIHFPAASFCASECSAGVCPDGFVCSNYTSSEVEAQLCLLSLPTGGELGESCAVAADCETGMCFSDGIAPFCSVPCVEESCPDGFFCFFDSSSGLNSCLRAAYLPAGALCPYGAATCVTGECAPIDPEFSLAPRCTALCTANQDCPPNFGCTEGGICVPNGSGAPGAPCLLDAECSTLTCAALGDASTKTCMHDCADGTCPGGLTCSKGTFEWPYLCVPEVVGGFAAGSPCASDSDCEASLCAPDFGGAKFCAEPCPQGVCEEGFVCKATLGWGFACFPKGHLPLGGDCDIDASCSGGACVLLNETFGATLCTTPCEDAADCPSGYGCDVALGVCFPSGALGTGQTCVNDLECASGACMGGFGQAIGACAPPCPSNDECPEESFCTAFFGLAGLKYVCTPAQPGAPAGAWCYESSDCASGMCVLDNGSGESLCAVGCPSGQCQGGLACQLDPDGVKSCVPPGGSATGAPCVDDLACTMGACVFGAFGDAGYCSALCFDSAQCPSGYLCEGGKCEAAGSTPNGGGCSIGAECKGGGCLEFNGGKVCGKTCSSQSDCDSDEVCIAYGFESSCVPKRQLGESCWYQQQCTSHPNAFCVGDAVGNPAFCTKPCSEQPCPVGLSCASDGEYPNLCVPTSP